MRSYPTVLQRMALAFPEQRRELGLTLAETAKLAGVHRVDVSRADRGLPVEPNVLMRLAVTMIALELNTPAPPEPEPEPVPDPLAALLELRLPVLAQPRTVTLGGAG